MLRTLLCLLLAAPLALAQSGTAQIDIFKKESPALQKAADLAIAEVPGSSVLQSAKAVYLEEFGIVVSLEVALEPVRNPFDVFKAPKQASQAALNDKLKIVRDKMTRFLTQKAPTLQSLGDTQSVAVVVHLFNSNPVDSPNLPRQVVFVMKKQEPSKVAVREQ